MIIYGIYDRKAKMFANVFPSPNDATAKRSFEGLIASPEDTAFTRHTVDFDVVRIAEISDDLKLDSCMNVICSGSEYSSTLLESMRVQNMAIRKAILEAKAADLAVSKEVTHDV